MTDVNTAFSSIQCVHTVQHDYKIHLMKYMILNTRYRVYSQFQKMLPHKMSSDCLQSRGNQGYSTAIIYKGHDRKMTENTVEYHSLKRKDKIEVFFNLL